MTIINHPLVYTYTCTCIHVSVSIVYYQLLQVWDACSDARVVFDQHSSSSEQEVTSYDIVTSSGLHGEEPPTPVNMDTMGYIVESRVVRGALGRVVEECEGVEVERGTWVKDVKRQGPEVHSDRAYCENSELLMQETILVMARAC